MNSFSFFLITAGVVLILLGLLFSGKLGPLGKLPGDISVSRPGFHFYFPITTSLIISAVLTIIFWIIPKLIGK
jgi:hypothetical protein